MDRTLKYAEILTQTLRKKSQVRYPFNPGLKIIASCDADAGQFLLVRIGWDGDEWHHVILFHAQLIDGKVIIEADMTEGLKPLLLEAGIREEDFLSDRESEESGTVQKAA